MSNDTTDSLAIEHLVDRLCDEFERALSKNYSARIEPLLERLPRAHQAAALIELLKIEFEQLGKPTENQLEEYRRRFIDFKEALEEALRWADRELADSSHLSTCIYDTETIGAVVGGVPVPSTSEIIGRYEIQALLGEGAFGRVYQAYDIRLNRQVALKVASDKLLASSFSVEALWEEARASAALSHPGIVRIYEYQTEEDPPFIVQELIEGGSLESWSSKQHSYEEIAYMMVRIADAVGYAHENDLFHLDLKPSNILMDHSGNPHIADFGLAIHESAQERFSGRIAGTPAYMSPEQIRGETHRIDGRADIWAMGVILYELLTGRRPFRGQSRQELYDRIVKVDPRPLRQRRPSVPAELERICLKCLQKRAADRYLSCSGLKDDIEHAMSQPDTGSDRDRDGDRDSGSDFAPSSTVESFARIVPKGLRSFNEKDQEFFLDLLPGPRDRLGLPESIRFWKSKIEETDFDETFSVGLLYGPSGCGKSSFVKAGLLPKLGEHVRHIYLECTADDTESRLLATIRKRHPNVGVGLSLADTIAYLREEPEPFEKLVVVLDQFEQWLHANSVPDATDLVSALRHCDGARVQCLVMVRDDFYMAANRVFRQLETPLVEGQNCALIDLFEFDHAEKVLTAFGRAYGRIPEDGDVTDSQQQFLKEAVRGLANEGRVICVRLALFAQMLKGRKWNRSTLDELGGIAGVGESFLEETFVSPATAPAGHRHHQAAARGVLAALMPPPGTGIKGHKRTYKELMEAAEYEQRPQDFRELIRILDQEVRLISPAGPEQLATDSRDLDVAPNDAYYQLTHDYMVPALRDWLTRKQQTTRRGRAKLTLESKTKYWIASKKDANVLPGPLTCLSCCVCVPRQRRTEDEQRLLRAASRKHAIRLIGTVATILMIIGLTIAYDRSLPSTLTPAEERLSTFRSLNLRDTEKIELAIDSIEHEKNDEIRNEMTAIFNDTIKTAAPKTVSERRRWTSTLTLALAESIGLDDSCHIALLDSIAQADHVNFDNDATLVKLCRWCAERMDYADGQLKAAIIGVLNRLSPGQLLVGFERDLQRSAFGTYFSEIDEARREAIADELTHLIEAESRESPPDHQFYTQLSLASICAEQGFPRDGAYDAARMQILSAKNYRDDLMDHRFKIAIDAFTNMRTRYEEPSHDSDEYCALEELVNDDHWTASVRAASMKAMVACDTMGESSMSILEKHARHSSLEMRVCAIENLTLLHPKFPHLRESIFGVLMTLTQDDDVGDAAVEHLGKIASVDWIDDLMRLNEIELSSKGRAIAALVERYPSKRHSVVESLLTFFRENSVSDDGAWELMKLVLSNLPSHTQQRMIESIDTVVSQAGDEQFVQTGKFIGKNASNHFFPATNRQRSSSP